MGQALHPTNGKNQTNNKKTRHELRELKKKDQMSLSFIFYLKQFTNFP